MLPFFFLFFFLFFFKKDIESLNGRLEVKDRAMGREVDRTKAQSDLVVMEQRKVKALEDDIHVYAQEAAKQRKLIYQLEKERERLGSDAAEVEVRSLFLFFLFLQFIA